MLSRRIILNLITIQSLCVEALRPNAVDASPREVFEATNGEFNNCSQVKQASKCHLAVAQEGCGATCTLTVEQHEYAQRYTHSADSCKSGYSCAYGSGDCGSGWCCFDPNFGYSCYCGSHSPQPCLIDGRTT